MATKDIPPSIDRVLQALASQKGLAPRLAKALNGVFWSVVRAFGQSPPDVDDIAKAREKVRQCLALEAGDPAPGPVAAQLTDLAAQLEGWSAPAAPAPPAAAPDATGLAPAPAVIEEVLSTLAGFYSRRGGLLDDPMASWRDVRTVDGQIQNAVHFARWNADVVRGPADAALRAADGEPEKFAGCLSLLHSGGAESVFSYLAETRSTGLTDGPTLAFRMCTDARLIDRLTALLPTVQMGTCRLALLAQHVPVSPDALVDLLDAPGDDVAGLAAELLAWIGRPTTDGQAIERRLRRELSPERRCSFLYAAVALGSRTALAELRRMLDTKLPITERAVEALAVAGGPGDAGRLLNLAARVEALAPVAVLAAGHLGAPESAEAIAQSEAASRVKDRALRTIFGATEGRRARTPTGDRLLYGEPWSVESALTRLADPDELVRSRRWHALEMGVRTGTRPGVVFDAAAPVDVQEAATANLHRTAGARRRPTAGSGWSYFGVSST